MYGRYFVGCYYYYQFCVSSNPISNSSFNTGSTYVTMNSPYNTQMFFYGFDRMIASWSGNPSNTVAFDTPTYSTSNSAISVSFSFTGNNQNHFTMGFSGFTIQTFYCPNTAPYLYYSYNANTCTDTCNNWIGQYANATRYCLPCGTYCYMCNVTSSNCTACYSNQNRVVVAGVCACDSGGGYYDDGTSVVCPKCYYAC